MNINLNQSEQFNLVDSKENKTHLNLNNTTHSSIETTFYRVTGRLIRQAADGTPYLIFMLSTCENTMRAVLWPQEVTCPDELEYCGLVRVAINPDTKIPDTAGTIVNLEKITENEISHVTALNTLPRALCAKKDDFDRLLLLVRGIKNGLLRQFASRALEKPNVAASFLKVPASGHHHHCEPGGLLRHSIEVAEFVKKAPELDELECDLAVVAGLFHDIGKIWTNGSNSQGLYIGSLVEHDAFTLELLAPALAWLDQQDLQLSMALRHIWTCASPGNRFGIEPKMKIAHLVRMADRWSAECGNELLSRKSINKFGFSFLQGKTYFTPNHHRISRK